MEGHTPAHRDHGCPSVPGGERGESNTEPLASNTAGANSSCQMMLQSTMEISPYAKLLLDAMKQSGCTVSKDRHFSCEDCDGSVSGGFDADTCEIRAANLSGDCSLSNEISRFNFGLKQHHQACVRDRALRSILAVRQISRERAVQAVEDVFDSCFNDHEPFGRIPHCKIDVDMAYRDFKNRGRYANV
ncbi:mitochondrial inner membrane protease ATP23 homolog isoform X2 [Pseudophryne corroboree]|uniref:mitochondrial inner membrane protease ATP23 homolog isoform X2 n=1 Tax=Pseudophryne corroboree TaxID=495146 RepID=UPI0030820C38